MFPQAEKAKIRNNIAAHNFEKVDLLEAKSTAYQFDKICLSELYFDSSILSKSLSNKDYELVRDDHSRGVCGYTKEFLSVRLRSNRLQMLLKVGGGL